MPNLLKFNRGIHPQIQPIRSFVRRESRITPAQKKALEQLWPFYGIDPGTEYLNLEGIFDREAPRILEIGFGNGESLIQQAKTKPETDFIGIEVYQSGIGRLLACLETEGLKNVRVICADAWNVLQYYIADQSLNGVQIFFPDPWPKKRHHKRRLIQTPFIDLIWYKIKSDGWLHLATDWQNYATQMMAVLSQYPGFYNLAGKGNFTQDHGQRPSTKFERRGRDQGNLVWDLIFKRSESTD